eukprot:6208928-Pleurochrysis_carterae.AAC.1
MPLQATRGAHNVVHSSLFTARCSRRVVHSTLFTAPCSQYLVHSKRGSTARDRSWSSRSACCQPSCLHRQRLVLCPRVIRPFLDSLAPLRTSLFALNSFTLQVHQCTFIRPCVDSSDRWREICFFTRSEIRKLSSYIVKIYTDCLRESQ